MVIYHSISNTITPLGYKNTPLKILDATGNGMIADVLTQRSIRVVRADVGWNSRRIHFQTNTSRGVMKYASDKDLRRLLEKVLREISGKKLMLVTYKFLKDRMLRVCQEIDPAREYMAYHFNGPRGVNDYETCDGVVVLGLPYSNLNSAGKTQISSFRIRLIRISGNPGWSHACCGNSFRTYTGYDRSERICVELAIISKQWPRVLPEPDQIMDLSKSEHWRDLAIKRLEPYVREFGFLNPDIGFLANVYIKQKITVADKFRDKVNDLLKVIGYPNSMYSPLLLVEKGLVDGVDCFDMQNDAKALDRMRCKSINVIYNLYYIKLLEQMNLLPKKILRLNQQVNPTNTDNAITLSTNQQWAELLRYFKDKYPHYESFKIKLPYTRNNYVSGVGVQEKVIEFYEQLSELGLFGRINTGSLRADEIMQSASTPYRMGSLLFMCRISDRILSMYIREMRSRLSGSRGVWK